MKQTTKKSYELPSKKMGGPISGPGKLTSSQNSLKHGITAKQFLSTPEKDRYEQLAKDLILKYASDNPLVTLQIERITKLQIQLERVQMNIDYFLIESASSYLTSIKNSTSSTTLPPCLICNFTGVSGVPSGIRSALKVFVSGSNFSHEGNGFPSG